MAVEWERGEGRPIVVLYEQSRTSCCGDKLLKALSESHRILLVRIEKVIDKNFSLLEGELLETLSRSEIRHGAFVAFGATGSFVQYIALTSSKIVQRLVIVDGQTRAHPTLWDRALRRVERSLPLGLPLRRESPSFDGASLLQRIRCPLLVVSCTIDRHLDEQAKLIASKCPTAWGVDLTRSGDREEALLRAIESFLEIPARQPQKGKLFHREDRAVL